MRSVSSLEHLRNQLIPPSDVKGRVFETVQRRVAPPALLTQARQALHPVPDVRDRLWAMVRACVTPRVPLSSLERIRLSLLPTPEQISALRLRIIDRLHPTPVPVFHWGFKWASAFVLFAFVVRMAPFLFLAPGIGAESLVIILPTRGEAHLSLSGWWQPVTSEVVLREGTMLRTEEGEATVMFHDDGVVRLAPFTTVSIRDISNRPGTGGLDPTLILHAGSVWVQGLLPPHLSAFRVATSQGEVVVHEGSVSITEGAVVEVSVWNRRGKLMHGGQELALLAGERTQLWTGNVPLVKKIGETEFLREWVAQNLERDAVHRREVAQLQHERRVAQAGILPTSPFYSVKRVAEAVDVLLTFGEDARVQKTLEHAHTRLNEAAALISEGEEQAAVPLEEYRQTLMAVASGSGGAGLARFLLQQEVAESVAAVAAALPGDSEYLLKRAVLEASAAVGSDLVDTAAVEGVLLLDTLTALHQEVDTADLSEIEHTIADLQPYLDSLYGNAQRFLPDVRREARSLLSQFALALHERAQEKGDVHSLLLQHVVTYLPPPSASSIPSLTDEELTTLVEGVRSRVLDTFSMKRSRENQLFIEMEALHDHPDRSRILRRLYEVLPPWFAGYVREEMKQLRAEIQKEGRVSL